MCRTTRFLLSLLLLLLVACTASSESIPDDLNAPPTPTLILPPPVLPNLLLQVTGKIEVRRAGSALFVPVALGAAVQPGDRLRLVEGEAAIFCGNEALWDASPQPLSVNEDIGVGTLCQEGRPPRPAPDLSGLRGEEDSASHDIPYALSPRSGFVIGERPTLRWYRLSEADSYTVSLISDDGQERPPVTIEGNELPYPDEWPALEGGGASYRVLVEAGGQGSNQEGGFSLLDQKKAEQVRDQAERLRQRLSEDDLSLTLLLAELYLNNKLRSEAIELLLALPDGNQVVAVQRLLGKTYLEMGLLDEARAAYSDTLTLAQEASLPEEQAAARFALGLLACDQADEEQASTHWEEALNLYEELEQPTEVEKVETDLAKADQKCVPQPTATPTAP